MSAPSSVVRRVDGAFDIAADHREHVVEIVGDTGGKLPDGFELLRLAQLPGGLA